MVLSSAAAALLAVSSLIIIRPWSCVARRDADARDKRIILEHHSEERKAVIAWGGRNDPLNRSRLLAAKYSIIARPAMPSILVPTVCRRR